MPGSIQIKHPIRIIHEVRWRRIVYLRSQCTSIISSDWSTGRDGWFNISRCLRKSTGEKRSSKEHSAVNHREGIQKGKGLRKGFLTGWRPRGFYICSSCGRRASNGQCEKRARSISVAFSTGIELRKWDRCGELSAVAYHYPTLSCSS
jgi:hypothetical protein